MIVEMVIVHCVELLLLVIVILMIMTLYVFISGTNSDTSFDIHRTVSDTCANLFLHCNNNNCYVDCDDKWY